METEIKQTPEDLLSINPAPIQTGSSRESVVFSLGRGGMMGVKVGMTQVYHSEGVAIAVTVIDLKPNVITQIKTNEKNGYSSIQVGKLEC